jgi:hypothetical protein
MAGARKNKTSPPKKTKGIRPKRIEKVLNGGPQTNKELRESLGLSADKYDPRLDRKLQQLRKEGKIHLVGSRWALNTVVRCPHCQGRGWVENKAKTEPPEPSPVT